jgi:hypothetical protein
MRLAWTLLAFATLGSAAKTASAERPALEATVVSGTDHGSHRGVSDSYLVLPSGGELTGEMTFLTTDAAMTDGGAPLKFSDLALFGLVGRYALFSKLELSGHVELLPKQPARASDQPDEKAWQSVGFGLRSPIAQTVAVGISGSGGHLLSHDGSWVRQSIGLQFRKPIHEILTFDISGGADTTVLLRHDHDGGWLTELGVQGSALFRDPYGKVGGWVGIGYAIPVSSRGNDPTSDMKLDPRARVDFRIGGVLSVVDNWDLFAELAVIDRGDRTMPATQLPILDGGFDQRQIMFGVTRHVKGKATATSDGGGDNDMAL